MCAKLKYHVRLEIFLSMVVIMQNTQDKADLQKTKVNATKITKVRADGNKLRTGKGMEAIGPVV